MAENPIEIVLSQDTAITIPAGTTLGPTGDADLRIRTTDYTEPQPPTIGGFTVTVSSVDPFGVTASWQSSDIVAVIDWGDGVTQTFYSATTAEHEYMRAGLYEVTLTVVNSVGTDMATDRVAIAPGTTAVGKTFTRCAALVATVQETGRGGMV